jgi:ligand-binding SRPBCC domain-containing protein
MIGRRLFFRYNGTMPVFDYIFTVAAPLTAVAAFHHDTRVLKRLTPPPLIIQVHKFEPMAEGSISEFTLWVGPIPLHWTAVHSDVSERGFTDRQKRGPLKFWQHTHRFTAISPTVTQIHEHIEYSYSAGLGGLFTRLLFNNLGLTLMFTARKWITRRALKGMA